MVNRKSEQGDAAIDAIKKGERIRRKDRVGWMRHGQFEAGQGSIYEDEGEGGEARFGMQPTYHVEGAVLSF